MAAQKKGKVQKWREDEQEVAASCGDGGGAPAAGAGCAARPDAWLLIKTGAVFSI